VFEAAAGRGIDKASIAVLAARYAVPPSYSGRFFAETGGLISYRTNYADMCRQVGLCGPPQGRQAHGPAGYAGHPVRAVIKPQYRTSAPTLDVRRCSSRSPTR
jgi:hypothetical protein